MPATWEIRLLVSRQKGSEKPHFQPFTLTVDPDEYVLDAVERLWAFHDRSLVFRHACHHSTCGACAMLVNGVEKLTCITPISSVVKNGGTLKLEPLRNFKVVSDLAVDMGPFYENMETVKASQVLKLGQARKGYEAATFPEDESYERLVDCIECGMCVSACPIALTSAEYVGPAVLAGAQQTLFCGPDPQVADRVNSASGAWRCHSAYECTEVCPSHVDPGWRIMDLRRRLIRSRIMRLFGLEKEASHAR